VSEDEKARLQQIRATSLSAVVVFMRYQSAVA
jgi:hypothetical protein